MARLPITEAAKVAGVSRVTLHRYIKAGKLSRHPDGTIDTAELQRAGFTLQHLPVTQSVTEQHDVTLSATEQLLVTLQHELEATRVLLQQERARTETLEARYHDRETRLLHLLEQAQLQSQRLLEAPRPLPPTQAFGGTPRLPQPAGALPVTWQRILGYMREQARPMSPLEVEQALRLSTSPRHMMNRMVQAGLLQRVEHGQYAVVMAEAEA